MTGDSARETGCRRSGPAPPPGAAPEPGTGCPRGRARAPARLPGSGAQTTSSGPPSPPADRGRRLAAVHEGHQPRRPPGRRPRWATLVGAVELDDHAPTPAPTVRTAWMHSSSSALGRVEAPTRMAAVSSASSRGSRSASAAGRIILDVDAVDLLHLGDEQVDEVGVRAARRPARRWPGRRPARGCRCRRRRRRPHRCGWPPRRARRDGRAATPGRRRSPWAPRYGGSVNGRFRLGTDREVARADRRPWSGARTRRPRGAHARSDRTGFLTDRSSPP